MTSHDETQQTRPTAHDPLIGELVGGKYRVQSQLAQGGMARIYRAVQEPLGRAVALKVMAPQAADEAGARFQDRFFLEASTCAKLKHPNTVTLFDYGHHPSTNSFYMVMELVEGRSLAQALTVEGRIAPIRALTIGIEICRSLGEAHQLGVVHRDLKPSNVMLAPSLEGEVVKVLDFGIAKVLEGESQALTMEDRVVGSPRYMSPEQCTQGPIDARTDVYALGVMLFEMISGVPPFHGRTAIQTLMMHVNHRVPLLSETVPALQIVPELDALIAECMAKEPDDRPQDIDALRQRLRHTLTRVADTTDDIRLDTESVIRHALAGQLSESVSTQPTLNQQVVPQTTTQESTFSGRAPVVLGGITVMGLAAMAVASMVIGVALVGWAMANRDLSEAPTIRPEREVQSMPDPMPTPTQLSVNSTPEGAEIYEGETFLGLTPWSMTLGTGEVPARTYEIRLEGHQPYTLDVPATDEDLELVAELIPAPVAPVPVVRPVPAPKNPDLDILDER